MGQVNALSVQEAGNQPVPIITNMSYSPVGQIKSMSYANGIATENIYDPLQAYRLTGKKISFASRGVSGFIFQLATISFLLTGSF